MLPHFHLISTAKLSFLLSVWERLKRLLVGFLLKEAGLPDVRFHDLRHGAATVLLAAKIGLKAVSELLGHSSVAITADIYGHVLPEM